MIVFGKRLAMAALLMPFLLASAFGTDAPKTDDQAELQKRRAQLTKEIDDYNRQQERDIASARLWNQRTLDDLLMLFPEIKTPAICYQTALSNYLDDKWTAFAKHGDCPPDLLDCKSFAKYLKPLNIEKDAVTRAFAPFVEMGIGESIYKYIQPVDGSLAPDNKIDSFNPDYIHDKRQLGIPDVPSDEIKERLAGIETYLKSCQRMKPASWSQIGIADVPNSSVLMQNNSKLGLYNILVQHLIGSQAPMDKKGYVGCLARLNWGRKEYTSCANYGQCETIPADNRAALLSDLDDLKARGCTDANVRAVAYHMLKGPPPAGQPLPLAEDQQRQADADKTVTANITDKRAQNARQLNDLTTYFSPELKGRTPACYQAALSTYVEDQWNRIQTELRCDSKTVSCAAPAPNQNQKTLPAGSSTIRADIERGQVRDSQYRNQIVALANTWVTAAAYYKFLRSFHQTLVSDSALTSFFKPSTDPQTAADTQEPDAQTKADELRSYVDSCGSKKPLPWSVLGSPFETSDVSSYTKIAIKLGLYTLLMNSLIASEVPVDKAGYVGCLSRLYLTSPYRLPCGDDTICLETMKPHGKEEVAALLDELKSHQCDLLKTSDKAKQYQSPLPSLAVH